MFTHLKSKFPRAPPFLQKEIEKSAPIQKSVFLHSPFKSVTCLRSSPFPFAHLPTQPNHTQKFDHVNRRLLLHRRHPLRSTTRPCNPSHPRPQPRPPRPFGRSRLLVVQPSPRRHRRSHILILHSSRPPPGTSSRAPVLAYRIPLPTWLNLRPTPSLFRHASAPCLACRCACCQIACAMPGVLCARRQAGRAGQGCRPVGSACACVCGALLGHRRFGRVCWREGRGGFGGTGRGGTSFVFRGSWIGDCCASMEGEVGGSHWTGRGVCVGEEEHRGSRESCDACGTTNAIAAFFFFLFSFQALFIFASSLFYH